MSTDSLPIVAARPVTQGTLSRFLIPSFTDLFFLLFIAWSFLAGESGWLRLLMDSSAGIHIRVGDYILATRQAPTVDMFSYSFPGKTWYAFEWLTELLFGAVHSALGLKGIVLVTGLTLALTFTILLRSMLARGANCFLALILTLVAANSTNIEFHSRPHIFTYLLLVIAAWMVEHDRRNRSRTIWLLVPITILWTNLHGGFFVIFAFLGILTAGSILEALLFSELRPRRWIDALRYGVLTVGCIAASLVNPFGIGLHEHVLYTIRSPWVTEMVSEFKSPSFRSETLLAFMAVMFVGLAVCSLLLMRRKITETLWILFFAYCSLVSVRHVPLFLIVATPIIAIELSRHWSNWVAGMSSKATPRILDDLSTRLSLSARHTSIWAPVAVMLMAMPNGLAWPTDFPDEMHPVKMASRHNDLLTSTRLFTTDQWADYLIYKNYPKQRVFFDDRHQFYGEKFVREYAAILNGLPKWKTLLDQYKIETVLCDAGTSLAALLSQDPGWRKVDEDKLAALFVRQ